MKVAVSTSQPLSKRKTSAAQKTEPATVETSRQRSQVCQLKPRQKKTLSAISNKYGSKDTTQVQRAKMQQLFSIIDTFYATLCDLPLQKLITSSEPQNWISEQCQTLRQLQQKLDKLPKAKDYQYYHLKLQSVATILNNIKDNLTMLSRITNLRNYCSGTESSNYMSRQSSCDSETKPVKLGDFAHEQQHPKEMLSYDHYIIATTNQKNKLLTKQQSPDMKAETIYSEEQSSAEEQQQLAQSEVVVGAKQAKRQRPVVKYGQNQNISNMPNIKNTNYKIAQSNLNQSDLKDKTLCKLQHSKANSSQRTFSNHDAEKRFLEDRALQACEPTTRSHMIKQNSSALKTMEVSKDEYSPSQSKQGQYIELIKQLRLELISKDREIQNLLINEQSYQQAIELFKQRENNKNKQALFLKESLCLSNKEKERLESQIKKMRQQEDELKQTIRLERERNHKEETAKQKIQDKYCEQLNTKEELIEQIQRLTEQNRQSRKNERVVKEKLEIYTKKYYSLYSQLEQKKEEHSILMKEFQKEKTYRGKTISRYEEIKEMVEFHKEKLLQEENL